MKVNKFRDFDTFYDSLLPAEKGIYLHLRQLIQENFPQLREKFGYGVPYYHQHSRVCFMYPASFPYSGRQTGVVFGFTRGHLLSNAQGLLDLGDRKEVAYVLEIFNVGRVSNPADVRTLSLFKKKQIP